MLYVLVCLVTYTTLVILLFQIASGLFTELIMLPPVFHTARKVKKHEDDAMYTIPSSDTIINARQSFMGSTEKYLSPLPSAPPRTSAYGASKTIFLSFTPNTIYILDKSNL